MIEAKVAIDSREVYKAMRSLERVGARPPLRAMSVVGVRSVLRNFNEGGRPEKWHQLSMNTIAARRKGSSVPLQDRGDLKRSVHAEMLGTANFGIFSTHPVAPFHQFGTGIHGDRGAPYPIVPIRAKMLAFNMHNSEFESGQKRDKQGRVVTNKKRSMKVFSRGVLHPGVRARPFMLWQKEDADSMVKIMNAELDKAMRK